jgi:hypothetical protein
MSNPTNPFGWVMPESTDLVTNLPADFEVFGQAVATSMGDLLGGTTGQVLKKNTNADMDFVWSADSAGMTNPMTTTGDVIYSSPGSTPVRLGIGSAGQILKVNSGATAPEWGAAPAAGGYTLISTTTLSSTATTISSIPTTYSALLLIGDGVAISNANYSMAIKFNSVTTGYVQNYNFVEAGGFTNVTSTSNFRMNNFGTSNQNVFAMDIYNAKETTGSKIVKFNAALNGNSSVGMGTGSVPISAAITSITLTAASGNLSGTVYLLGV